MRFFIEVGLEDLASLPESFRQQIRAALNLDSAPATAPAPAKKGRGKAATQPAAEPPVVQQPPAQVLPTMALPQAAAAAEQAVRQPLIQGDRRVFPPTQGHFSQLNAAVDVSTGQPVPLGQTPAAPPVPQMQSQAVSVQPVQPFVPQAPVAVAPMPVDAASAKALALRTYNRTDIDGKATFAAALQACGLTNASAITDANAGHFVQALRNLGVQ